MSFITPRPLAMPQLFGTPGRAVSGGYVASSMFQGCVSREFTTWALNRTSPVIEWLRVDEALRLKVREQGLNAIQPTRDMRTVAAELLEQGETNERELGRIFDQ